MLWTELLRLPCALCVLCPALQLLPNVAWPGSLVRDSSLDVEDHTALRSGWWWESSAVWGAVKKGDEALLNKLLDSIKK